jgi:hypothetical protein
MSTSDSLADRVRVIGESKKVPGLLFRVTAERLRAHCRDRAGYHERRATEKNAEVPAMEAAVETLTESIDKIKGFTKDAPVPQVSNKSMANYGFQGTDQVSELEQQIEKLRQDIKDHQNKSASFSFLADSLFEAEYALEWGDLGRLEIVK